MAKNTGKGYRRGCQIGRGQILLPNDCWAKIDTTTGQIIAIKRDETRFKGVRSLNPSDN